MKPPREVSAAVVRRPDGKLLVQARPDPGPWQGYWEFPGGGREPGEDAEACARRECMEEVGLELARCTLLQELVWQPDGVGGVRVAFFLAEVAADALPSPNLEQELRWVSLLELAEMRMLPTNERIVKQLLTR